MLDNILATDADRARARLWADYAVTHYGIAAIDRLRGGFARGAQVRSKRTLRLALRCAERKLRHAIFVTVA